MRKIDIVAKISDITGVPKTDVLITLEAFFKEVKNQVSSGENVYVRGFGSFIAKKRAQKIGRIISRGESIVIPEHYIPAFKPAEVFMEQMKDYKPKEETPEPPTS
jgi:DNA-binding protein HU-beta